MTRYALGYRQLQLTRDRIEAARETWVDVLSAAAVFAATLGVIALGELLTWWAR